MEEIHHRVKNNLAHISGILELQSYNTQSEEAYTVLQDSQSRVQSIAMIHDQLYQHESFKKVRVDQYIERLTKTIERTWETDDTDIDYHLEADPISLPVKEAVPCGSLINELITNATKHAFKEKQKGNIWIELRKVDQMVKLRVEDDGSGLPDDFSIESEDTLGVNLINNFARQLDGELSYETGDGTSFTVLFNHPVEVEN